MKKKDKNSDLIFYLVLLICGLFVLAISKLNERKIAAMENVITTSDARLTAMTKTLLNSKKKLDSLQNQSIPNDIFPKTQDTPGDIIDGKRIYSIITTQSDLRKFTGVLRNTSVEKTSGCEMVLTKNPDGSYRLKGETDNVNLVGKWDLTGYKTNIPDQYVFEGEIDFGYPESSFPAGTKADFKIIATINAAGMTGRYVIEPFPGYESRQDGILDLQ